MLAARSWNATGPSCTCTRAEGYDEAKEAAEDMWRAVGTSCEPPVAKPLSGCCTMETLRETLAGVGGVLDVAVPKPEGARPGLMWRALGMARTDPQPTGNTPEPALDNCCCCCA